MFSTGASSFLTKLLNVRVLNDGLLLCDCIFNFISRRNRRVDSDSEHGQRSSDSGCFTVFDIASLVNVRRRLDLVSVTLSDHSTIGGSDRTTAHALRVVNDWKVSVYSPVFVLVLLTKELDTLVYFDVLLATDVRGLELVIRHELNC